MKPDQKTGSSRREFLKQTGTVAAASAFVGIAVPKVHAGENNTIQIALVGCGGRGTGAAGQAMSVKNGPVKLVAMADLFDERLTKSFDALKEQYTDKMDVHADRKFVGFDAYQKAMDCLRPSDVVIFATPLAFRGPHFAYAIDKGLNVFMEKPLTADGPTSKKMFALGEEAQKRNLKVGVGLMCRHCEARQELHDRIRNGEIGDITMLLRAYRMGGPSTGCYPGPNKSNLNELLWQVKTFHAFLWAGGGIFSDYLIHNIDECCWMKDAWPVQAKAVGGRHYHNDGSDQNFDAYSVEYIFADGARLFLEGRYMVGCFDEFASYAHGTKGSASISATTHTPNSKIYKTQQINNADDLAWAYPRKPQLHYQKEWDDLIDAIRENRSYNEVKRGVEASLVTSMGRMAAHTGKIITFDDMLNSDHEFAPGVDKFTMSSPAPVALNSDGKYPVPVPGMSKREYA